MYFISRKALILVGFLVIFFTNSVFAQNTLTVPRVSPHASVSQTIGISSVTIDYHRPAVQNREIWGKLVPYGLVNLGFGSGNPAPWRAGANENTTITFSDDATVEGNVVKAGTYGLHMIPTESEWTIILSNQTTGWGSYFYDESEDYLRFTVMPKEASFTEWLFYGFSDLEQQACVAFLQWEKLRVEFRIEFDVHQIVINSMENELIGISGFNWGAFNQAASYAASNNVALEKGLAWINKAIAMNRNMTTLSTKSRLLNALGKKNESQEIMNEALELATEAELNQYGYQLLGSGDIDGAIEMFKLNVQKYPDSWNVYDSLGDAYQQKGNNLKAKEYFQKALGLAPENQKTRINQILLNL